MIPDEIKSDIALNFFKKYSLWCTTRSGPVAQNECGLVILPSFVEDPEGWTKILPGTRFPKNYFCHVTIRIAKKDDPVSLLWKEVPLTIDIGSVMTGESMFIANFIDNENGETIVYDFVGKYDALHYIEAEFILPPTSWDDVIPHPMAIPSYP